LQGTYVQEKTERPIFERRFGSMKVLPTPLPDIRIFLPKRIADARGYFAEWYNARDFAAVGLDCRFVQDNLSLSKTSGTLRGLHFQTPPHAQDKLVGVLQGAIFDVAVDIRLGSPTYGQHVATELSAELGNQLFVPKGFAHGFCTLKPDTLVVYKVTDFYDLESDAGIAWNDPQIAIAWPMEGEPAQISGRDSRLPRLAEIGSSPFLYEGSQ
jgi:dTDP-4-dehydrorhamnose 3,5-epimerase